MIDLSYLRKTVLIVLVLAICFVGVRAYPGQPDSTFGNGGSMQIFPSILNHTAVKVRVQTDGKLLFFGNSTNNLLMIRRTHPNGDSDLQFGFTGYGVRTYPSHPNQILIPDHIHGTLADAAIQSDGKIVVVGSSEVSGVVRPTIWRLTTGGVLDFTFGTNGVALLSPYTGSVSAIDISQSKLFVVYTTPSGTFVGKRHSNGNPDLSFGTLGSSKLSSSTNPSPANVRVVPATGKIYTTSGKLRRYHPDGSFDNSFGFLGNPEAPDSAGCSTDPDEQPFSLKKIELQSNGRLLVGGVTTEWDPAVPGFWLTTAVTRYLDNGTIDNTFNLGALACQDRTLYDGAAHVRVQSNGQVLVGSMNKLHRLTSGGIVDFTYNSPNPGSIRDMAIQGDGKVVAVNSINAYRYLP